LVECPAFVDVAGRTVAVIRELGVAELDQVSGGNRIEIRLQVTVQRNTEQGVWAGWLGGKLDATEAGKA
jgi:hypothetical protein